VGNSESAGVAVRSPPGTETGELRTDPLASRELAAFAHAAEAGTIQGAAEALSLTQSAATKRIQQLERRLGVRLLVRSSSGVAPSEAGRALYPKACEALAALREAERSVRSLNEVEVLRLAASHTVGEFLLPAWLTRFRLAAAGVQPQVDVVNSTAVLELLRRREIEMGFVEGEDRLDDYELLAVARDQIHVVVAPSHRWAKRRSLDAEELTREPYVAREAGSGTRSVAEGRLRLAGVKLTASFDLASLGGVKLALAGGGFSLISRLAVREELQAGTLAAIPVAGASMDRTLFAVRNRDSLRSPGATRFWRFLRAVDGGCHGLGGS